MILTDNSELFVSNSTGPIHLAGALNKKIIGFLRPILFLSFFFDIPVLNFRMIPIIFSFVINTML